MVTIFGTYILVSILCFVGLVIGLCTMYMLYKRSKDEFAARGNTGVTRVYPEKFGFITHMMMTIFLPFVELVLGSIELYYLNTFPAPT